MGRPKLLDLFCCAGGASAGYQRAGFDVYGVDLNAQPRYPFAFHRGDALAVMRALLRGERIAFTHRDGAIEWLGLSDFAVLAGSPPCQGYTAVRFAPNTKGAPLLIDDVRALFKASGKPWVIENVEGAKWAMRDPLRICGTAFGLGAVGHELRRHRLFESNKPLVGTPCQHTSKPVVGVYGGHPRCRAAKHGGRGTADFVGMDKPAIARECMGIDWMTMMQMSEAIPPAYTEHLGKQLIAYV